MIYFIGDIHGQFKQLVSLLKKSNIQNSVLIQVGDFGTGLKRDESLELDILNQFLLSQKNKLYIIRGNHDDPSYFINTTSRGNITFLKDYTILDVDEKKILLAGGSISIDRGERVEGNSYWKNEGFAFSKESLVKSLGGLKSIDIVVTHNAPAEFWPFDFDEDTLHFMERDKDLQKDLLDERMAHSDLMAYLEKLGLLPKVWYYGHYHKSLITEYNGISYRILNAMEIVKHESEIETNNC